MKTPHQAQVRFVHRLMFGIFLILTVPCSVSLAQTITSSGLNTTVSAPIHLPSGQTQFDITGGTRPGGGANLFHSFGNFNVPDNNIANFFNDSGLPTSNILGRVTGGNISNIFGTIQTTGFGNANLFLMNPAGFLFGPNATVNVGGMVTFTSADYLRLADNARFNAIPHIAPDLLLSAAPIAAFGFLGSNPGAITVQGSQLTVAEGTGISLVGGNITVHGGTLTAPSGDITLVSVGKPSKPNVGGEVVIAGPGQVAGFTPTGFRSLGTINLTQASTVDVESNVAPAGGVLIRGGQFVMDNSLIAASTRNIPGSGGNVEMTANDIALSNGSRIFAGDVTFNANILSATNSSFSASAELQAGAITIQGLQGSGTYAHVVSLENTVVAASSFLGRGGPITIRGDNISLNETILVTASEGTGGPITLVSRGNLNIQDSQLNAESLGNGGTVDLRAGTSINLTSTIIDVTGEESGSITMAAPVISLRSSRLDAGGIFGGTITLTGTKSVNLSNGTVLSVDSFFGTPSGTIQVEAKTVSLTDTHLTASTTGGPQTVGGSITVNAKNTTLTNSQILSSAMEGQGGTIGITSSHFHQDAGSVIDASSQSGTNGTVTINGIIQP